MYLYSVVPFFKNYARGKALDRRMERSINHRHPAGRKAATKLFDPSPKTPNNWGIQTSLLRALKCP